MEKFFICTPPSTRHVRCWLYLLKYHSKQKNFHNPHLPNKIISDSLLTVLKLKWCPCDLFFLWHTKWNLKWSVRTSAQSRFCALLWIGLTHVEFQSFTDFKKSIFYFVHFFENSTTFIPQFFLSFMYCFILLFSIDNSENRSVKEHKCR